LSGELWRKWLLEACDNLFCDSFYVSLLNDCFYESSICFHINLMKVIFWTALVIFDFWRSHNEQCVMYSWLLLCVLGVVFLPPNCWNHFWYFCV
jgi:hypothetical protein